ncbi:MAG TPA: HEAT repeat domain-containing protein [bacterium]
MIPSLSCSAGPDDLSRLDWQSYQNTICLNIFHGEIVLPALGHGHICGHPTPNCNQAYCGACAAEKGACEVCGKKNTWLKNTDPATEASLLLAMLKYSKDTEARRVAIYALGQINNEDAVKKVMAYAGDRNLWMQIALFLGEIKDDKYAGFLQTILHSARDDYFGDENRDIEKEYYIAQSAQAAANSLARIGTGKAKRILINAALHGRLWERCYAITALGEFRDDDVRNALHKCLREFFAENSDWKWIPGRDLIGAALGSLAKNGNKETALLVLGYIIDPGCDFLYEDLRQCLSSAGKSAVPEIIRSTQANLRNIPVDYANQILIESLGAIGDTAAVDFFITLLDTTYADEYLERDIKNKVLESIGKVKGHKAFDAVVRELMQGRDEWTRQVAAQALGQLGGRLAFDALVDKLKAADGGYVTQECLNSLNAIAFKELKNDSLKLVAVKWTALKNSSDAAFQLMQEPMNNGETWAVEYYFEIINKVSVKYNLSYIVQLLDCRDKKVFDRTIAFLKKLTKLNITVRFTDPVGVKNTYKNKVWEWFQDNYNTLN